MSKVQFFLIDNSILYRLTDLPDGGRTGEAFNPRTGQFEFNIGYAAAAQGFSDLDAEELTETEFNARLKKISRTAA